jgi:hypothetical protein
MEYTYKYPRPAVTADCAVITKEEGRGMMKEGRSDKLKSDNNSI